MAMGPVWFLVDLGMAGDTTGPEFLGTLKGAATIKGNFVRGLRELGGNVSRYNLIAGEGIWRGARVVVQTTGPSGGQAESEAARVASTGRIYSIDGDESGLLLSVFGEAI
jgi:hypothetical protein